MCNSQSDDFQGEPEFDTVSIITEALMEKFGERSGFVAQRQVLIASAESRDKWVEVVRRLSQPNVLE